MKSLHLTMLALFCAGSIMAQEHAPHGKAAKGPPEKAVTSIDAKLAAVIKDIDAKMVQIEGGSFTMGCTNPLDTACFWWEKPRHTVTIGNFYLSKYIVTQKEWKALMGNDPSDKNCPDCPVINVSWFDAQLFINKLNQLTNKNYRLPTEAEWEYAAKGGNKSHGFKYPGSDSAWAVAWYDTLLSHTTHPVGQKQPNELGLYDMGGNVWQWCSDWFDEKYYTKSPSNNPQGPQAAVGEPNRALRGGSWWGPMKDCRVANRDKYPPDSKDDDVGFRLARGN